VNFRQAHVLLKSMSASSIEIDGSLGEGGGQILRTALALSLVTGKSFRLVYIRARRPKPGLQPQHLMCVRAAATIAQATVHGASLGSSDLTFEPGEVVAGKYHFAIGTAGATSLVLHTLYLPLALRGSVTSHLTITGGTHVKQSPSFHFLDTTWRRYLELVDLHVTLNMWQPGFYPRGGGIIEAHVQPCAAIRSLRLDDCHNSTEATGLSVVARLPADIARRQARRAAYRLREAGVMADITEEHWDGGPGTVLALTLATRPVPTLFCGLGQRGKPAERVADDAVNDLLAHVRTEPAGVDLHSADQLVLPLALAAGPSVYRVTQITQHLLTNIATIHRFVERDIMCEGIEGGPGVVRIA
jgi:RNA 3'-terminal phosphate cyclase (ATP)